MEAVLFSGGGTHALNHCKATHMSAHTPYIVSEGHRKKRANTVVYAISLSSGRIRIRKITTFAIRRQREKFVNTDQLKSFFVIHFLVR